MDTYVWQKKDWPKFLYDRDLLEPKVRKYEKNVAYLLGMADGISTEDRENAAIDLIATEITKTSSIEGEILSRSEVRSSIIHNLNFKTATASSSDVRASGIVNAYMLNRQTFTEPLTEQRLFDLHISMLKYRRDLKSIGYWRTGPEPMRIVSGSQYDPVVHFVAPPSEQLPALMAAFVNWFNSVEGTGPEKIIAAGIGHVYFETIHPFEDGNGRIGRLLIDKLLSQHLRVPVLFSVSAAIEQNRQLYYNQLQKAQRTLDLTDFLIYFMDLLAQALDLAKAMMEFTLRKRRFLERFGADMNERQLKAVSKMFDAGPSGFQGGMNNRKYVSINRTSMPTATRDMAALEAMGAFRKTGKGRSTSFELVL